MVLSFRTYPETRTQWPGACYSISLLFCWALEGFFPGGGGGGRGKLQYENARMCVCVCWGSENVPILKDALGKKKKYPY